MKIKFTKITKFTLMDICELTLVDQWRGIGYFTGKFGKKDVELYAVLPKDDFIMAAFKGVIGDDKKPESMEMEVITMSPELFHEYEARTTS